MTRWLSFSDIDQATIYRYRKGQISQRADVLNADDEVFQAARRVYEIGPFDVPLWEAMWGSLGPADFKRADDLMPGREWSTSVMNEMFFEDPILARIVGFRKTVVAIERMTSDLEAFTAAIRVCRACRVLMRGNALALRVLLEGTLALPGARGLLGRLGLVEPLREWIVAQFEGTEAGQVDAAYRAPCLDGKRSDLFRPLPPSRSAAVAGERKIVQWTGG